MLGYKGDTALSYLIYSSVIQRYQRFVDKEIVISFIGNKGLGQEKLLAIYLENTTIENLINCKTALGFITRISL